MTEMSLRLRGPVSRSLWNRVRRRFVRPGSGAATAAVAAGVLVAAAALEPNLSGVWVMDGTDAVSANEFKIYHVGSQLKGYYLGGEELIFGAEHSGDYHFDGFVYLVWADEDMREKCGSAWWREDSLSITYDRATENLELSWTRSRGNPDTCEVTSRYSHSATLERISTMRKEGT